MEPGIKRVESSLRCLTLVCYMTPSLVEHEVEDLGYAETAGAGEELRVVVAEPSQEGPVY